MSRVVVLAATRLRQPAATEIAEGQKDNVEPRLVGTEVVAVTISGLHHQGRDEHADHSHEIRDELGGLERRLGLGRVATLRALNFGAVSTLVWAYSSGRRGCVAGGSVERHACSSTIQASDLHCAESLNCLATRCAAHSILPPRSGANHGKHLSGACSQSLGRAA